MVVLFSLLIVLQFVIIISHDLIDIPGLVSGSQIQGTSWDVARSGSPHWLTPSSPASPQALRSTSGIERNPVMYRTIG